VDVLILAWLREEKLRLGEGGGRGASSCDGVQGRAFTFQVQMKKREGKRSFSKQLPFIKGTKGKEIDYQGDKKKDRKPKAPQHHSWGGSEWKTETSFKKRILGETCAGSRKAYPRKKEGSDVRGEPVQSPTEKGDCF